MTTALERVQARAAAIGDPPPANPPAQPVAPPAPTTDLATQVDDLTTSVSALADRVAVLEQAAVDDAMSEMDGWAADGMMAALPQVPA